MDRNEDKRLEQICTDIREIKENHLPHIYKRLDWLSTKDTFILTAIGLGFTIIGVILVVYAFVQ